MVRRVVVLGGVLVLAACSRTAPGRTDAIPTPQDTIVPTEQHLGYTHAFAPDIEVDVSYDGSAHARIPLWVPRGETASSHSSSSNTAAAGTSASTVSVGD